MEDCGKKCAKYLLFAFNIFVWIAGAAVLGIGIYLRVGNDIHNIVSIADIQIYYSGCYVLIAAGSFMFLLGFLGCCGAMAENKCLLILYMICLSIIFVVELGVGIWAVVNQDSIENDIAKAFNQTIHNGSNPQDPFAQSVIALERQFKCCGLSTGCQDWKDSASYGCTCDVKTAVNGTCVLASSLKCTNADTPGGMYIYKEGCYQSIIDFINKNLWVVVGIGFGIGFVELLGVIFAGCVIRLASKHSYGELV
uniref:Tetraspanin n=1 Tax=Ciona savignyi TaxID=51511 RepID=H2YYR2_CIOSA